ncbi:AraC family transcriptional regulator [Amycolatopsis antarctica]|uniref:AraC family transcriptional regulator n=1 Tax=Amycolatopsis antarctica TaxID=1854586 RepID=A0A263CYJ5_9PSEU|nr:AraC family transcriptional regulator [Amycolatopsis antarctica]OZM71234.1 AraC family transcriptional regulator [Amycolatopsis antarctica]
MPQQGDRERAADDDGADETPWRIWIPPITIDARREGRVHVLLWQMEGTADLTVKDQTITLTKHQALWIPVGTRHKFTVHAGSVLMPVIFDAADTATTLCEPGLVTVSRELRALMLAYVTAWNSIIKPEANLARQILGLIEPSPVLSTTLPMPASEPARIIAETLRFNPGDTRSAVELAESVHTSSRTIRRAFETETGISLRQWRIQNRMEAASILLRSDTTLDAVAHRVGYTNVNAFRRVFHGHFGVSPTEYARRYTAT